MVSQYYRNPEPVPPASQLAVLPFVAAIDGFLRSDGDVLELRTTIHRTMSREGSGYLQQVCPYMKGDRVERKGVVGRIFPIHDRLIGEAAKTGHIWRTKRFIRHEDHFKALKSAMSAAGDSRDASAVAVSYLAIPFLGPKNEPVLILYADCKDLNYFFTDDKIRQIVAMCTGFCHLFDSLQEDPFTNLRNFPLQKGEPSTGELLVYDIQEPVKEIKPPRFKRISSFNYEAAVA